ncbi:MAG: PHP domain-containing protein [Bacillota bacterium]|nr:PHP domain-containing protein [Bacillota bacterium]
MGLDLHVHTTASDGSETPAEVVRKAKHLGLSAIALTDHDSVGGLEEGLQAGKELGLEVVPGIELTSDTDESEVHLLGYYIDHRHPRLRERLREVQAARVERAKKMVDRLREHGIDLQWEEVWKLVGPGHFIGRTHLFKALENAGLVAGQSKGEAFRSLLGREGLAYVPHYYLSTREAVRLIREAGGVPVLAHPGRLRVDALIKELMAEGLRGVEVYYPAHTPAMVQHYLKLATELGLIVTGGTDYHGRHSQYRVRLGEYSAPPEALEQLRAAAEEVRRGGAPAFPNGK